MLVAFRRLAAITALSAYLQIALGGVVRVSGSGLGCRDWPLCNGRPYPPANLHSIIEYSHRAVGSVIGLLIIATVVMSWVVFRTRRPVVAWLASASLIGVVGEIALGWDVVANGLSSWLVLAHLALAMVILGCLVAAAVMAMPPSAGVPNAWFRKLAAWTVAATYVLLLTGSTVVASGVDQSCRAFPLCGNGFSLGAQSSSLFAILHRSAVVLFGFLIVLVLVMAWRRYGSEQGMRLAAVATLLVLAAQVIVGAGAALTDGAFFNGLHVALATLVWAGVVATAALCFRRADSTAAVSSFAAERRTA